MNDELAHVERFHGHLGPFAVIGFRMGKLACEKLGDNPFEKQVNVSTGTTPPLSCIIDGIQLSSGCTLGKGNITVDDTLQPIAEFKNKKGNRLKITLRKTVWDEINTNVTQENIHSYSEDMYQRTDSELFEIEA